MGFACSSGPQPGPLTIYTLPFRIECILVCPGESWENFPWIPLSCRPISRRNLSSSWETLGELRTKWHCGMRTVNWEFPWNVLGAAALAEWIIRFSAGQWSPITLGQAQLEKTQWFELESQRTGLLSTSIRFYYCTCHSAIELLLSQCMDTPLLPGGAGPCLKGWVYPNCFCRAVLLALAFVFGCWPIN